MTEPKTPGQQCRDYGVLIEQNPRTGLWIAVGAGGLRVIEAGHESREACEAAAAARLARMNNRNPQGN